MTCKFHCYLVCYHMIMINETVSKFVRFPKILSWKASPFFLVSFSHGQFQTQFLTLQIFWSKFAHFEMWKQFHGFFDIVDHFRYFARYRSSKIRNKAGIRKDSRRFLVSIFIPKRNIIPINYQIIECIQIQVSWKL